MPTDIHPEWPGGALWPKGESTMSSQHHAAASILSVAHDPYVSTSTHSQAVTERLPFRVRIVAGEEDLKKAVHIRQSAYARHVPAFARQLEEPEAADYESGSLVLVAESKLDGTAVGTMRIQTNRFHPLRLEESVELPAWLQDRNLAEATRLGVGEGSIGRVVKTALFKAYYLFCMDQGIDWMVITARKPLDRQYEALLFKDVFEGGALIPMHHVGNMPHRVMAFDVARARCNWSDTGHPLLGYMCNTHHPDIDVVREDCLGFGGTIAVAHLAKAAGARI
jgi:hypothetical protein